MKEVKDTIQVAVANGSAIGFSITDCNEILTLVSLVLAISFTIYKYTQFEKKKVKQLKSKMAKKRRKKGKKKTY